MTTVGRLFGKCIKNTEPYEAVKLDKSRYIDQYCPDVLSEFKFDSFSVVRPTDENTRKTVSSWDDRVLPKYDPSIMDYVTTIFDDCYGDCFVDPLSSSEEIFSYIDDSKSAGYPWNEFGCRTKTDVWKHPLFTYMQNPQVACRFPVFWNVRPKVEPKEMADILDNKIRLFQISPVHLLYFQHMFGYKTGEKLKNNRWSAYGFNPYNGGFDRLARSLLMKPYRFCYDVSGWDKFLPIMSRLYDYKRLRIIPQIPEELHECFEWVTENVCCPHLILPDGTVVVKAYGNPSGSGTTTQDNILCHILIMMYSLFKAYVTKTGLKPTPSQISEQVVFLFGDDNIGSVDEEFSLVTDLTFMQSVFTEFGMKIKFLNVSTTDDLSSLSFLGASFIKSNGHYYPLYDQERLAYSLLYGEEQMSLENYCSRLFSLYVMSYKCEKHALFKKVYDAYRQYVTKLKPTSASLKQFCVEVTSSEIELFYTGAEGKGFSNFLPYSLIQGVVPQGGWLEQIESICLVPKMAKVTRGERLLSKWANDPRIELTKPGKDWLIAALDPFHDSQLKDLQGWPDVETAASVVRCVKQTINVTAVSGGSSAPATTWDCHIALLPFLQPTVFEVSTARKNNIAAYSNQGGVESIAIGGLTCLRADGGANANWMANASVSSGNLVGQITLADTFAHGVGRLVGVGYEVTDTTAEIYKQGSVVVYRQPEGPRDQSVWTAVDTSAPANSFAQGTFTGTPYRLPPQNSAQAMLIPGSRQWAAKDGVYQVGTFHSNENPPYSVDYNEPVFSQIYDDDGAGSATINTGTVWFPKAYDSINTVSGSYTMYRNAAAPMHLHPIHQSGCVFSGLNANSSLQVSVIFYYESFPTISEQDILVLARPSCEFDPMALSIYSHALSVMPVGVPVGENETGDWFFDIVSKAGKFLSPILAAIPHPIAQAAAPIAALAGQSAQSMISTPSGKTPPAKAKRKRTKNKNLTLQSGVRTYTTKGGKTKTISGPMRAPA